MKVTYDKSADAAYVYFADKIEKGEVAETYALDEHFGLKEMVNIDVDKNGHLLGIEVLGAQSQLPKELLDSAEIIG